MKKRNPEIIIDTSVIVAVLVNETERDLLVELTSGADLIAPGSVHWEMGNAFAAMLKRRRIGLAEIEQALLDYSKIPIRFLSIDLPVAMRLAAAHKLYAYDAYVLASAVRQSCPLLTLDSGLMRAARAARVDVLEV